MQDKVILNEKSFKALSAESRVSILKNLTNRRMTLSELSKKLNLKNSTVKEHCDVLTNAELIKKIDEGRKWKYYELTKEGREVITPSIMESARVMVMLSISAILFSGIILTLLSTTILGGISLSNSSISDMGARTLVVDEYSKERIMSDNLMAESDEIMATGEQKTINNNSNIISLDYNLFSGIIILVLVIGLLIGFVARKKF